MKWYDLAWADTETKVEETSHRIGVSFPHRSKQGRYDNENPGFWTAGFWPGLLWLIYRDTGIERFNSGSASCRISYRSFACFFTEGL